jgi:hypothetical protein
MANATPAPSINPPAGPSEFITDLSAAVGFSQIPAGALFAVVQAETQNVRYRDDGTDPTASVGMLLIANTAMRYEGDLTKIKFKETSASAKLNVSYYK